jgi:hypothetical protein
MRSSLLSALRQITSSRQSPRMSAHSTGVALEPLLEWNLAPSPRLQAAPNNDYVFDLLLRDRGTRSHSESVPSFTDLFGHLFAERHETPLAADHSLTTAN